MKRTRSSLHTLLGRRARAAAKAPNLAEVLRGTFRQRYVRCGKPNCHCRGGRGHGPFLYLSITLGVGQVEQITIDPRDSQIARQFIRNYQRLHRVLELISGINRQLLRQRQLEESSFGRTSSAMRDRRRRRKKE